MTDGAVACEVDTFALVAAGAVGALILSAFVQGAFNVLLLSPSCADKCHPERAEVHGGMCFCHQSRSRDESWVKANR